MAAEVANLEKLTILSFDKPDRKGTPPKDRTWEAMFNPTTYAQTYAVAWHKPKSVGGGAPAPRYTRTEPGKLALTLVLDGTGVADPDGAPSISVKERLDQLLKVAYAFDGDLHEPRYLVVVWGKALEVKCRLSSVAVRYTLFDRDGSPLRAELTLDLIDDDEAKRRAQKGKTRSPDLTHTRLVRAGDTLPQLTREVYGSPAAYIDVARWNGLDDLRHLTPGRELLFPPLATLREKRGAA